MYLNGLKMTEYSSSELFQFVILSDDSVIVLQFTSKVWVRLEYRALRL